MDDEMKMEEEIRKLLQNKSYTQLRNFLELCNPADISAVMEEFSEDSLILIYRLLSKEKAVDVFAYMDKDTQEALIKTMTDTELRDVIDDLFLDDTVDLIGEMPSNVVKRILKHTSPEQRTIINELLNYPDGSAGSIMTIEFVDLKSYMTVSEAFEKIKKVGVDKETIYTCYVVDEVRTLIGIISVKTLLLSDFDAKVGDIMETEFKTVNTFDDVEDVAKMFDKYDLLAVPVVDNEQKIVGIVTVDDAIDVIHEETEEDFAKMAAITPTEKEYLKTSPVTIWLTRIPWLMLLMISATFTGMIISSFEDALAKCSVLVAFIPMLMDSGGNSGSQASVTIIRGISLGEIEFKDILKVVWKEFRVAILCGVSLAVICFFKIMLIDNFIMGNDISLIIAFIICLTLSITVFVAKIIGCSLPLFAKKLGFDPAVMASPFITTIVDALSLIVYFSVATIIMGSGI